MASAEKRTWINSIIIVPYSRNLLREEIFANLVILLSEEIFAILFNH